MGRFLVFVAIPVDFETRAVVFERVLIQVLASCFSRGDLVSNANMCAFPFSIYGAQIALLRYRRLGKNTFNPSAMTYYRILHDLNKWCIQWPKLYERPSFNQGCGVQMDI